MKTYVSFIFHIQININCQKCNIAAILIFSQLSRCVCPKILKTHLPRQGFPNGVDWWGDNLGKMAKNCMKITKSAFLGQNSGGGGGDMGGEANFSGSGRGGDPARF